MRTLAARQVFRRFLVLEALRWLPRGLPVSAWVLLPLERGLTVAEVGVVGTVLALVGLALELPTGGLADAFGRRPVVLAANVFCVAGLSLLAVADSLPVFLAAGVLFGIFLALDSGPLEAWYVDSALAADLGADIEHGLSRAATVASVTIAAGSLAGGGLIALGDLGPIPAVAVPVLAAAVLEAATLVAVSALLVEDRPARDNDSVAGVLRSAAAAIGNAVTLARGSRIVLALLVAELLWTAGAVTFETLSRVRLADVAGGVDLAGVLLGPVNTAGYLASALGAGLVPLVTRRLSPAVAAVAVRLAQAAVVAGMALAGGVVGLVAALLLCYVTQGMSNPVHMALLHRQAGSAYRSSLVSLDSMVRWTGFALGSALLTGLASAVSVPAAMITGAAVLAAAAPFYLPARRAAPVPVPTGKRLP